MSLENNAFLLPNIQSQLENCCFICIYFGQFLICLGIYPSSVILIWPEAEVSKVCFNLQKHPYLVLTILKIEILITYYKM